MHFYAAVPTPNGAEIRALGLAFRPQLPSATLVYACLSQWFSSHCLLGLAAFQNATLLVLLKENPITIQSPRDFDVSKFSGIGEFTKEVKPIVSEFEAFTGR